MRAHFEGRESHLHRYDTGAARYLRGVSASGTAGGERRRGLPRWATAAAAAERVPRWQCRQCEAWRWPRSWLDGGGGGGRTSAITAPQAARAASSGCPAYASEPLCVSLAAGIVRVRISLQWLPAARPTSPASSRPPTAGGGWGAAGVWAALGPYGLGPSLGEVLRLKSSQHLTFMTGLFYV